MRVLFVCKLNTASDWLTNSPSTLESQSSSLMRLSRPSSLPHQNCSIVAESRVGRQQLQGVASVCNATHSSVINSNGVLTMEIVIC